MVGCWGGRNPSPVNRVTLSTASSFLKSKIGTPRSDVADILGTIFMKKVIFEASITVKLIFVSYSIIDAPVPKFLFQKCDSRKYLRRAFPVTRFAC